MLGRFGPEWQVPTPDALERSIAVGEANGQPVVFDPRNTILRIFRKDIDCPYNQIIHGLPSEHILVMPLNHPNMASRKDRLLNEGYTIVFIDEPDAQTLAWYDETVQMETEDPDS